MPRRRLKKGVIIILVIICLIGIIYSSYNIIKWKLDVNNNKEVKRNIDKKIKIKIDKDDTKYKIDFNSLKEINPDTIGYINVNNTNIAYVVVKGDNNKYYLKHNFEKEYNIAGWIFADYHNKFDESDKNIVIYGHNTKDGSMFGTLEKVITKEWYENKDNYDIVLVTENATYNYQVFSTYSIKPEDYYIKTEFNNDFYEFINRLKNRSIYDYNVEVNENDKILTLSSCTGSGEGRVVLHAKLINKQ